MSEYTPKTGNVRNEYVYGRSHTSHAVSPGDEFDRWLAAHDAEVKAEAWDEGHRHCWRRDRDGCMCGAWSSSECGCGLYGTGDLRSLADNPYREGTDR